ncbi:acyl carrier protein [Kitasatospora sp. NPDC056076]|uniref:acyl carrier protein n=1 Tax=unclassified Kitasatospora TaxID=2633591 RepID=UPI0035D899AC
MTTPMTVTDLRRILVACAGEGDGPVLDENTLDTPFEDLGYDSLALMETASRIERELGVTFPGDAFADADTPAALLAVVNGARPAVR